MFQFMRTPGWPRQPVVLFFHIPKTGGTTLRHHLEARLAPDELVPAYTTPVRGVSFSGAYQCHKHLDGLSSEKKRKIRVLFGHLTHPDAEFVLRRQVLYATFLRNPVDQILSNFKHTCLSQPGVREKGFKEWFRHSGRRAKSSSFLTGRFGAPGTKSELIQTVKGILDQFSFIGITENADSYRAFYQWMNVDGALVKKNTTSIELEGDEMREAREVLERRLNQELEIYDYARALSQLHLKKLAKCES